MSDTDSKVLSHFLGSRKLNLFLVLTLFINWLSNLEQVVWLSVHMHKMKRKMISKFISSAVFMMISSIFYKHIFKSMWESFIDLEQSHYLA